MTGSSRASSNRAASLTRQLLAFSRQQTLRPEVLQLPDVVSEISQILKRLIGEKIQLVVTHDRWFARSFDRYLVFGADGRVRETTEPVWDEARVNRLR